jgi:hypothetical protein
VGKAPIRRNLKIPKGPKKKKDSSFGTTKYRYHQNQHAVSKSPCLTPQCLTIQGMPVEAKE